MFDKILIANRGEIACRIIKTAHRLGIRTVAVYSTPDKRAMHVSMADEAWWIGAAPASESYLRGDKIIDIALQSGAEAIHPGYGFLAENADFAQLCQDNGLTFIGPPVSAIEAMGSKSNAKEIMTKAGVPLVPGYHGQEQSLKKLLASAEKIGFPVMLKPSAGGGGKGMRIVHSAEEFSPALDSCKREALASFSDDEVLVEKYLLEPRHIEIQIFADNHGNAVHLFERDCSVQRRHQKIIEEAPAPGLSDAVREAMADVAIKAAKAIGYAGAGTVEFLHDSEGKFYFMEMNTRLQVEHPVTEMITGYDLVEWQLQVASDQRLPVEQEQISSTGHAVEVRIYAEDPDQNFLPATGSIVHLQLPHESSHVRIDTGIRQGDVVSTFYDPMIAKLITWDCDRESALARLRRALDDFQVVGVTTNLAFLRALAANQDFKDEKIDTGFIDKQQHLLFPPKPEATPELIALAALYMVLKRVQQAKVQAIQSPDPYSPWHLVSGWRNNKVSHHAIEFTRGQNLDSDGAETEDLIQAMVHFEKGNYIIDVDGHSYVAFGTLHDKTLSANLSGHMFGVQVIEHREKLTMFEAGKMVVLGLNDIEHLLTEDETSGNPIAPMPGTIIEVSVKKGDPVKAKQTLLILEAMKMEHSIVAPTDGVIVEILYQAGELVQEGTELIIIDPVKR